MFFRKSAQKKPISQNKSYLNKSKISSANPTANEIENSTSEISKISENLSITGSIISSGKINFNGTIKGTIESNSLYVGEKGFIDGKVEADEAVILGRVKGSLKGKKVRLASTSKIEGDTYHQVIAIEDGAIYEGSIKRIKNS